MGYSIEEQAQLTRGGEAWKGHTKGVINLCLIWVPGHHGFAPNKYADEEWKKATQGDSSDPKPLPLYLRKGLPHSITALHQDFAARLGKHWSRHWKTSQHTKVLHSIDNSATSKKFLWLTKDLNCSQASIIMQLCTGHISLNQHLFRIHNAESPSCPHCQGTTVETVKRFLLDCLFYCKEWHALQDFVVTCIPYPFYLAVPLQPNSY